MIDLRLGDCLEILPTLDADSIDAVVTDPPYGMRNNCRYTRFSGANGVAPHFNVDFPAIRNDFAPFDPSPWLGFSDVILWGSNHFAARLPVGTMLVWDKRRESAHGTFLSDAEVAWQKGGMGVYVFRHEWSGFLRASERGQKTLHPTQKPVALFRWCLSRLKLPPGATVLDPYMGSGPCGIACVEMGYNYIGIEIEPEYYRIAEARITAARHVPCEGANGTRNATAAAATCKDSLQVQVSGNSGELPRQLFGNPEQLPLFAEAV